jgi:hypothetical protein
MYKKRSQFIQGIKKESFHNSIIADHPPKHKQPIYKFKRSKKYKIQDATINVIKKYGSKLYLECKSCGHNNSIHLNKLIRKYGSDTTLKKIVSKFYCNECKSRKFAWVVQK